MSMSSTERADGLALDLEEQSQLRRYATSPDERYDRQRKCSSREIDSLA